MTTIDATGNLHDTTTGQFTGHIHTEADASRVLPVADDGSPGPADGTAATAAEPAAPGWHKTLRTSGLDPDDFELKPTAASDLNTGDVLLVEDRPVTLTRVKRAPGWITAVYFDAGNFLPLSVPSDEQVQVIKPLLRPDPTRDEILRLRHQHQKWSPDDHTDFLARDMAAAGIPFCRNCADWHKPFEVCSTTDVDEQP